MLVIKEKGCYVNYDSNGKNLCCFRHMHSGPILILDLDGTIRDDTHRHRLLPSPETLEMFPENPNAAYKKYQSESHLDPPVTGVINIVKLLQNNYALKTIILSTGTASKSLRSCEVVCDQLRDWDIDYDLIVMRNEKDQRHSVEQKISCLDLFEFTKEDIRDRVFALDDASLIVEAFRAYGITTLQVK